MYLHHSTSYREFVSVWTVRRKVSRCRQMLTGRGRVKNHWKCVDILYGCHNVKRSRSSIHVKVQWSRLREYRLSDVVERKYVHLDAI